MRTIKRENSRKRLPELYLIASFLKETELLVDFTAEHDDDWGPVFKERLDTVLKIATAEEKSVLLRMSSPVFSGRRLDKIQGAQRLIWREFLQLSLSPNYDPNNLFWAEVFKAAYIAPAAQEESQALAEVLEKRIFNLSVLLRIKPVCTVYPAAGIIERKSKSAASLRP